MTKEYRSIDAEWQSTAVETTLEGEAALAYMAANFPAEDPFRRQFERDWALGYKLRLKITSELKTLPGAPALDG
jgi:hypothetical protein